MAQTKEEKLKNRLKEIRKRFKELEKEFYELQCERCNDVEYQMFGLEEEQLDIKDEIKQLKKKKK